MRLFNIFLLLISINFLYGKESILIDNTKELMTIKNIRDITKLNISPLLDKNLIDTMLNSSNIKLGIISYDALVYNNIIRKDTNISKKIKMIFPLYDRDIYIIVRKDKGINSILDLGGRRVNNSTSLVGKIIEKEYKIKWKEFHYKSKKAIEYLLSDKLDSVIIVDSRPSKLLLDIPKDKANIIKLIPSNIPKYYSKTFITNKDYSWVENEVGIDSVSSIFISNGYNKDIRRIVHRLLLKADKLNIKPYFFKKIDWIIDKNIKKILLKNMDKSYSFTNSIGIKFVYISQGYFKMGTDRNDLPKDEKPKQTKVVKSFYISTTEVTQKEWNRVMGDNPSYFNSKRLEYSANENPVDNISFNDALKFIKALNKLENRNNYRLPSEIEWEYLTKDDNYINFDNYAWYRKNSRNRTHRTGLKKPNSFGLYDLYGNVWEWCSSYYTNSYSSDYQENYRVLRGGSFLNLPNNLRALNRMYNREYIKRFNNGLRIVYDKTPNINSSQIVINYKVKNGDTLPKIAKEFYGNESFGNMLFYYNKKIIGKRPLDLKSGQIIKIPPKDILVFKQSEKKSRKSSKNGIRLLAYTDFSPFLSKSLPHGGMANCIVEEIFKVLDDNQYSITWERDIDHIPLLKDGQFDVGIAWYAPNNCSLKGLSSETKERCNFIYTKPIFKTPSVIYKRKSDKREPLIPKDLYNTRICRPDEWYSFDLEEKGLIDGDTITLVRPNYPKDCFDLLLSKRVDFVAFDKISSDRVIKSMNIENLVERVHDKNISTSINMTLMVYKDNPRVKYIIKKLNRGITILKKSGRLKAIQMLYLTNSSSKKGE